MTGVCPLQDVRKQWAEKQRQLAAAAAAKQRKSKRAAKDPRKALDKALATLAKKDAKSLVRDHLQLHVPPVPVRYMKSNN